MSVFARFAPRLQQAIVSRLGWSSLRPVQEEAGAALLPGDNAIILAPTAGGKTEAAVFPVLSQLADDEPHGVGALYVAPIKALLNNQADRLGLYTEMIGLRSFTWHGDTPDHSRRQFLKEPAQLLMTTPESLEVMLLSARVDENKLFADLRTVIVDEIHALAGSDRGAHLMSVIERLARISRHDVQRVGLSATVGNPETILTWMQGTSSRTGRVVSPPSQPRPRQILVVHRAGLTELSRDAAQVAAGLKSLLFCQSRSTTERQLAEERFHHGGDACIVCTSTLELGIDVGDLDRVLQAEAPDTVNSFLQRMGRTGRRPGQASNTTFLCETTEGVLQAIALVELAKAGWVEPVELDHRCWPVLIHQLLAMALAGDGITGDDAWEHLARVPDFQGIHRAEYDRLLAWMVRDGSLRLAGGRLVLGLKAERRFGRKNFMELFAVFSSPQTYTVQVADGRPLGSFSQAFVDRLVDGVSSFLLGGRAWAVLQVRHDDRRVIVEAAPRGRQPTWGGFLPQFLGLDLCQHIQLVLLSEARYPYLDDAAWAVLSEQRASMREVISSERGGVEFDNGEIRWWTFAGGRINATLRHALEAVAGDWQVISDNFLVKVRGAAVDRDRFRDALGRLGEPEFWEDERLWAQVAESPLGQLLANGETTKLIHHAPFEREVLGRQGLVLDGVVDTREASIRLRRAASGHSLREVCARELGLELDKREQTGDWTRRPLTESQVTYAALDAEVLLRLFARFEEVAHTPPAASSQAG